MNVSRKTRIAYFLLGLIHEPLAGFIAILPFILRKDLGASPLQIGLFNMVKPAVALLSFYWGASLWRNRGRLRANWMGSWLMARVPFLIFPFVQNVWVFIAGAAVFYFFQRGGMPAQMEILKQNVPEGKRETFFSWSSALNFLGGAIIGFALWTSHVSWESILGFGAVIGVLSWVIQGMVPVGESKLASTPSKHHPMIAPWKDSLNLLRERPDFARFQFGFMLGGIGLMLMMPALVLYSADGLAVSHGDMLLSRFVWMGLGFVIATPFWRQKMSYGGIYRLTGMACLLFAASALCWILASWHLNWFFVAFFLYGVAQAGSHLIWHLSGPLFAGNQESSLYSTVNILTVGLRGIIVPFMASLLCTQIGPLPVIGMGLGACLVGAVYLFAQKEADVAGRVV